MLGYLRHSSVALVAQHGGSSNTSKDLWPNYYQEASKKSEEVTSLCDVISVSHQTVLWSASDAQEVKKWRS